MFFNADSGLYLTQYRAYDPVPGRWLSRDPIGE
jgi:RHS repeat-associated protein